MNECNGPRGWCQCCSSIQGCQCTCRCHTRLQYAVSWTEEINILRRINTEGINTTTRSAQTLLPREMNGRVSVVRPQLRHRAGASREKHAAGKSGQIRVNKNKTNKTTRQTSRKNVKRQTLHLDRQVWWPQQRRPAARGRQAAPLQDW